MRPVVEGGLPIRLALWLADGSEYQLEIPEDHPAVARLLTWNAGEQCDASADPQVVQIPLDAGTAALTFAPRHLVRLELSSPSDTPRFRSRSRSTAVSAHPARLSGHQNVGQAPEDGSNSVAVGSFNERSTNSAGKFDSLSLHDHEQAPDSSSCAWQIGRDQPCYDPFTNVDEGHLGGYVRSISTRIPDTSAGPHGDDATWYPLLWQWLIERWGVRSMLDVGCGEGHAAGFFRDAGCEVSGIDGSVLARNESVIPGHHAVHDFVDGPFVPERSFDLVWSCEFVEHVDERFTHNFLAAFAASRRYLLMTFAAPGQGGWHHVNCRPQEYWIDKLSRLGFELDQLGTEQTRELAGHGHFMRCGLMFVRRKERDDCSFVPGAGGRQVLGSLHEEHLPVRSMEVARLRQGSFYLFHDIFVHATLPKIVAVCSYYGSDWDPAEHDVDYDAVDLVLGSHRFRGRCLRHRLDSWEPCILLEFEGPELDAKLRDNDEISFTIEVGKHSQQFAVATRPPPFFDVALSLVVRDENRWVRTFMQYYLRCLRVQHVFVYDNGTRDRDGLLRLLEPYRRRGEVTYVPWDFRWRNHSDRKMTAQPAQEAHSLNRFANCRWIGFFDVDELLRLPSTTAPAFLERFAGARVDGLSFGIRWFSYRGPLRFEEVDHPPLTYLYSRRDNLGRKRQKFFVKGGTSRFLRLHWLEEGRCELPIDDSEIFFHHYDQHAERFEEGKNQAGQRDDYMSRFHDRLICAEKRPAPATEQEWLEHIRYAFAAAERCQSQLSEEVLDVDGMCGKYNRHFYNNLCNFEGCRYLEIGSYHGASTCAALYANEVAAVCIDNWSEFRGRRGRFEDAVQRFRGCSTVEVIEKNCFDVDATKLGPFDVFVYDAKHDRQSQYLALERYSRTLADHAVIVVDDWSREPVRQGVRDAIRDLDLHIVFDQEIRPTPEETADENREAGRQKWWNGLYLMLLRRPSRVESQSDRVQRT